LFSRIEDARRKSFALVEVHEPADLLDRARDDAEQHRQADLSLQAFMEK